MIRGGREDLELYVCASSSTEQQDWNRGSNDAFPSKSMMCKGGRRKQSKPVKMSRSNGDETEEEGGEGVDDFSLLLEGIKVEAKGEEEKSPSGRETQEFSCAREICPYEMSNSQLAESLPQGSRVVLYRETSNLGGWSERDVSGAALETERISAGSGARIRDLCDGMEYDGWSDERTDSMAIGSSWSRGSACILVDGEDSFLDERHLEGDGSKMASESGVETNVTQVHTAEDSETKARTQIMEVVEPSIRTTNNKAEETDKSTYNERTKTRETTSTEGYKTSHDSDRKSSRGVAMKEHRKSTMISDKEIAGTVKISNREDTKTIEKSNSKINKIMDILDSQTIGMSNSETTNQTTVLTLNAVASTREEKQRDTCLKKTDTFELSSDHFRTDAATNFVSKRNEIPSDTLGNAGATETSTDCLKSSVHSQLQGKLHQSSNAIRSIASGDQQRSADNCCKTSSVRQCSVLEDYCEICQKRFCNKYYLKKHRQDVHGLVSTAAVEATRTPSGQIKSGTDDIPGIQYVSNSPAVLASSSEPIPLDRRILESDERVTFSSSSTSTSTPLLNYLVFSGPDGGLPRARTLPTTAATLHGSDSTMRGSHKERSTFSTLFGSSEGNWRGLHQSRFTDALSMITDSLQVSPGLGFLDAYLRLCGGIGGSFNGKNDWQQDVTYHGRDSAALDRSLADFETDAFIKFQDNYMAITKARKCGEQCGVMDISDTPSYGGILSLGGKRSFDFLSSSSSSSLARRNDDLYDSEVMSKLLKAEQFLGSVAEPVKSGFSSGGKLSDRVVCDLCGKEVCNKYFLKTHKTRVHGWREETHAQTRDRTTGLGPFSSTLSSLVDGISSSKQVTATRPPPHHHPSRKPSEETRSGPADVLSSRDSHTNDFPNGFCMTENNKTTINAIISSQSVTNGTPYFPFWSSASTSAAIRTPDTVDRTESLYGRAKWKEEEADVTKSLICRLCNKVVNGKQFMRAHMKRRHGILVGNKSDVKWTKNGRQVQASIESVTGASRIDDVGGQQSKESKALKSFSWLGNQSMKDDEENVANNEDIGSEVAGSKVVGQRRAKQNPDKSGEVGTCPKECFVWEKTSSSSDALSMLSVTRDSAPTRNTDNFEQVHPSKNMDDSINLKERETSSYTADWYPVLQDESVKRNRDRGILKMRLSPEPGMLSMDTHELDPKPSSLCSRDGQDAMDRIRCSLCRKRFRSSVQLNIHLRKVHASLALPNQSGVYLTPTAEKPEGYDRHRDPTARGKHRTTPSPCRVESPASRVGRRVAAMQQFLLREVTGLDLFCPALVCLPSLRAINKETTVTFTLTPMLEEELGQVV